MAAVSTAFKRLSPTYKALVALVAPIGTIIATLLALNVIQPFGEDAFAAGIDATAGAGTAVVNVQPRPKGSPSTPSAASTTARGAGCSTTTTPGRPAARA